MLVRIFTKVLFALSLFLFVSVHAEENEKMQHDGVDSHEAHSDSSAEESHEDELNVGELIMHHISDSHSWHIAGDLTVYLPVILYSSDRGFEVFSSRNLYHHHEPVAEYQGYHLGHDEKIHALDESRKVYDFSITKDVVSLFISISLMLIIFLSVAKGYKKRGVGSPKGIQSLFEPVIVFVRDEIVKPAIGPKYERYLPYLLTLFFFIWFNNLLGLTPGAANLTGNIAVTACLALFTFLYTNLSGNRDYWKHIFWTPGVPWWMKAPIPLMPLVEFIGIFTKPFSLLLRLFVSITAGHIVILSLISLTFIFESLAVGIGSSIFVTLINIIELLVATIQAYVFTLFSSMYIGMAVQEHEHHEEEQDKALA